jgi:hypothetical protein
MIVIPQLFWDMLLKRFIADRTKRERVAYLDGVRTGGMGVVTTFTVPNAERHPNYFRVSAEHMSAAGKHLLKHDLRRLVQVHSHGNLFVGHSDTDDGYAYSQRPGSLSIVVPHHGRGVKDLSQCGVHIRAETGWERLTEEHVCDSVVIVPSSVLLA